MKDLLMSPFFSDGMVLQRDSYFPIWSREKITVIFLGKTYEAKSADGKWLITLDPVSAGGPFEMQIKNTDESVTIKDVYSGDLWLCSGQSNMETPMERLRDNFSGEWELKEYPIIRHFKVPAQWDFSSPREDISGGSWLKPSKETLDGFTATPWFFAKYMYEKYRVPIGLINTAWGGTPIESWMSSDALADFPQKIALGERYADAAKREEVTGKSASAVFEWEKNIAHEDIGIPQEWKNPDTDISSWDDITLPGDFSDAGLIKFCGALWLAKDFEVGEDFASKEVKVWLGTIIDCDTVFINGVEIGNTGYRYPPRKYACKGLVKKGKNRIVIRVICNRGDGGVTVNKPFRIFTDNESVELHGKWKYKIGIKAPTRPEEFFFQSLPMGNFNAMVCPFLKYPVKGVIWYQGESNDFYPNEYKKLFPLMINDWRRKSNNDKLPFIFVQLPIFKEPSDNSEAHGWAIIREAQADAMSLPNTGMACVLELGEWNDIHPLNKKDVGYRLFLAADKTVFAADNTSPGPTVSRFERQQDKINIFFNNCGEGLKAVYESLEFESSIVYVSVIGEDANVRLPAKIESANAISIDISGIKNPKKILYAWANNPRDRQLFNSDGLPALPFKIELKQENNYV
ncbi:sialate O-acetylesterase [Treponema sp. R80B11-R83G3]